MDLKEYRSTANKIQYLVFLKYIAKFITALLIIEQDTLKINFANNHITV